jgi:hypothetical protein
MSSWSFQIFVDVSVLDGIITRVSNLAPILEKVGSETVKEVKNNIELKRVIDTGALLGSIVSEPGGNNTMVVRDGVPYGVYNEFGTYKMAARPFFVPAVEKAGDIFARGFMELLK